MALVTQPVAKGRAIAVIQYSFAGVEIPCPLCKSNDHSIVGTLDRHGEPLRTVMCRACGHVFTNPQPTKSELQEFYSEKYQLAYKGTGTPKRKHVYRAGQRALERLEQLQSHLHKGSRILDVGSGGGECVYLLNTSGYAAQGLEPNQGYAAFSRAEYGVDVRDGSLEELPAGDALWDGITLHHVLEHLAEPVDALRHLRQMLKPSGKLIIEVPNMEARYHGPSRQYHFAHLHGFSTEGLTDAGSQAGLEVTNLTLQAHTQHINVAFTPSDGNAEDQTKFCDRSTAERIERALQTYTALTDTLSPRPYRRLLANVKRPVVERIALARLGWPVSAKEILDRLYKRHTQKTGVN